MADNISKFYKVFSAEYDNFATEKDFRDWLGKADAEKMGNLYKAFSSVYDNFGSSEEMNSYLGWGKKREPETAPVETISRSGGISRLEDVDSIGFRTKFQPAQTPSRGDTIPAQPTATAEEQAPVAQPAEPLPTPDIMWGGEQLNDFSQFETDLSGLSEDEKFIREYRKKREEAKREAYGSGGRGFYKPATDKEKWVADNQAKYEEIIGCQANPLRGMSAEELAQMGADMEEERKFVEDYEKRAAAFKQAKKAAFTAAGKHTSEQMVDPAEREWLEQNKSRYADDKHKVELWQDAQGFTPEHKAVMAQNEHDSEIAREARTGSAIVERANWDSVLRINKMTEKVDNLGYKIDAKAGNTDDKIYAAVSQFAKGAAGNVDIDTITFGLASGLSLTNARRVGDKYNNLVTKALEDIGFTGDYDTLQKDLQKTYEQLLPISNEVSALNKRLEEMVATYNDMAKSGASEEELKKYYSEYEKVYAEYKQKYDEYAPMRESFDKLQEESNKIVTSVQNAVENGLDDSEKALLKALDRYTAVTAMRATTTSSFAKAGQAAEQSAEFMLDFILTGGLGKASSKMATKILRNGVLRQAKERGALAVVENIPEAMSKLTAMGVKPNLGARFLAEAGEAGIRTAIMFPRSIKSFGENLTEIDAESSKDAFGRRNFDRSWLNSGFNTLLTQYIEYWSEGFGTYFGEAESALFKSVTHGAPITSIGKTLSAYRGSLGKYLDYGKFDGLFNEGLEEVAGSLLNAMAGAFSKDRVGDSQAMDEFFTAENLSVLFMSFLPMSIISAGTNINAYNKMKDRYNDSVEVLSGFIESGAVSQEDLDNLKSTILESTPVQIKDKIVAIADKARQTNGGRLPSNFTQSLMGYVEGSLAMDMEGERWTDSAEKVQVATTYADAYANPDVRGVWDATDMEEQALAEAKKAGFTDEELDTDPYRLGQKALLLQQTDEKKSAALLAYATAKAQRMGLEDGYKNNTANMIADFEESIRNNADVDGNLIIATTADGKSVYITAKDATIGNDGSVSVNGADGVVTYWSEEEGDKTAKASDLTVNAVVPTDAFIARSAVDAATRSDAYYQTMAHTVSARGRARAINDKVGQTVYVSDGRGVYEPIKIVRMTEGGQKVVIKGNRGILDGISVMVQANIPRGSQMEVETARLYDVLAKDEDGSISSEAPASAPEAQAQQAPQAEAPVEEPAPAPAPRATETAPANGPAISDLQGNNYTIYINGTPYNVSVTRADERDGEVEVMYQDAEGNDIAAPEGLPGTFKYENFVQAMQAPEAAAQAEEQTAAASSQPAEAPAQSAPVTVEDSINDWLRQTIVALFDPAMTDADRRDFVDAVEKKLTDLHNKREALVEKGETDKPTMTTDIQAFIKAKEELRKKYTDQIDALDKEIAVEEGRLAGLNAALNEINSRYMPFTPVGTKTRFTESELEPANPVEAAADFISKAVKNGDFAIDMDSFKKETGYNGESQKYRFLKKKGGLPIRVVAEMLAREYPGFFGGAANERDAYESGNEGDDNSARDAIITLFSETKNRSEIDNYILNRRKEQAKAEADRQNEEIMRVIEETFGVPFDEYATRKDELIREDLEEIIAFELPGESFLTNLREYYRNKFNDNVRPADNASDQTENGGDVAEGEDLLSRGGDEVLPGEQPDGAVGPEPVGGNSSAAESTGIDTGAANGAPQSGSGLQSSPAEGVDPAKEAIRKAISEWSEKLGVPVIAHESIDSIQSGTARNEIARADAARARGNNRARVEAWYNPTTNTVEFYLPHIESESRIAELVMHEIVAHKGLRALFGEKNWNRLMDAVWDSMSARQRAQWINYNSHLKGKSAAEMRRAAADECVAHVAETVKEGKGVGIWKKFVAEVKKLLIELGLGRYIRLNNNDLSAFLLDSLADYKKNAEAKPFPAEATPESKTDAELSDAIGSKTTPVADVVDGNTTEGTEMFSKTGDGRSLVGIHNISEEKLGKALRLGGLVNPSSAVLDLAFQNHFGYGDISLIMPSSLVDSKFGRNIGTFDRDAYTPMYPDVEYFETKESREKVKEMLKDLPEELAKSIHHSLNMYVDGNTYNSGLEYLFLKEKGEETGIQKTPRRYPYLTAQKIKDMLGRPDLDSNDSEGLLNAYEALSPEQKMEFNLFYHADGDPAKIEADRELLNDKDSKHHKWFANFLTEDIGFGKLDQFLNKTIRDEREAGKENMALTIEEAVNTVAQQGYGKEFSMWLENKINDLGYDEKIFLGYTPSGNRRYMSNTLENVSKYMKSMGRNASEDHSFGPGLIKSKLAQKFTKLSQIAAQRDRLVNYGQNEEMESIDNRLRSLMESFMDYSKADSYGLYTLELIAWDYVQQILMQGKSIDSVIKEYEEKEGHKVEMTEEQKKDYEKLRDDIKNMPVHYFETKFERPVYLNEFAAAVVPSDINPGLKEALSDAGLPIFEYDKSSDASRREATLKAAEGEGIMFSRSFASAQEAQKQPNGNYPSDAELNEDIYFSLTKNNRATISSWLGKREDLSQEQRDSVMAFLEEMENPTLQLATAKWFTQGVVRLPEDMSKIEQAVAVARKAKVDPLQYASPMELIDKHADITLSEKPIDPDTVSTLHRASEMPEHGIVVYDVEDSEESRQNMRRIINTHFGKEASPWCLLQGDGEGNLTESSARYWKHYDGYPKQVVFRNGKLLAFSANDSEERLWWDRQDSSHRNIPAGRLPLEGDKLGRSADYIYTKNGKLLPEQGTLYYKGNTQNGDYSVWLPDGTLSETGHYTNGKEDGEFVGYWDNGNVASLRHYKNGLADGLFEEYYTNGNVRSRSYWKDGNLDRVRSVYYENGNLWTERSIRNGKFDGPSTEYHENGLMKEYIEYKDGKKDGVHRRWNSNGVLMKEEHFKNDELEGESRSWYGGGAISAIENYKNNRLDGIQENYEWDGWGDKSHLLQRNVYENGEKISSEEFFRDGRLYFKKNWDNEGRPNGVWKFWSPSGELTRMEAYNHSFLGERNLLAEGVTEEQADNLQFSKVTDPAEIERLENEDYVTVYRAMELIDGQLYPPMSQKEPNAPEDRGKRLKKRQPSAFNEWERSDEQPDRAYEKDGKWYFDLKKNAGSDVNGVLYNPYFHTSTSPLNDQFSSASTRPNLVVVECRIPKSELTSGYKAEKANDSVGPKDWHSGTVTAQIGEGREVILSRWVKPIRIVPDSEVADIIAPKLLEKNISVPYNVITPGLRAELEKKGVDIIDQVDEDNVMFARANANQEIFVSNAERAVENINTGKATPQQWLAMLEKNGGIKAGEDKWLGLSDWLRSSDRRTLDKQEVLDYVKANKIIIEETDYSEEADKDEARALRSYQEELDELAEQAEEETGSIYVGAHYLWAWNKMLERYGDDFDSAFVYEINPDDKYVLVPQTDWDDNLSGPAQYFIDQRMSSPVKRINPTRRAYTTQGLTNKREIALTVPTIEPWNESDSIHFGDAGEGRAIAWARFGDTNTEGKASEEEVRWYRDGLPYPSEYKSIEKEDGRKWYDESEIWPDYVMERNGKFIPVLDLVEGEEAYDSLDAAVEALNEKVVERYKNAPSTRFVLAIDEIQSKRHQEAREAGGYKDDAKLAEATDRIKALMRYYGVHTLEQLEEAVTDAQHYEDIKEYRRLLKAIPDAPFEKNWYELAMKRMLRLAAEEGYDYLAWTTGEQQAARYNIGQVVDKIISYPYEKQSESEVDGFDVDIYGKDSRAPIATLFVTKDGEVSSDEDAYNGKQLSEIIGKELSKKILESNDMLSLSGEDLRIGAEGMKGFYDDILPRFMNKYGKKWGVKVEDIELPGLEEGARTMHAIPITEEMRRTVMEGQLMFSKYTPEQGKKVVTEFQKKYTPLAKMFALATESRSERLGDYNKNGRIVIFVSNADSEETVEQGCFHENFHAFGVQAGLNEDDFRAINEFFFSGVDEETRKSWEDFREELKQDNEYKKYPEQETATRLIAGFMQTQNMARVLKIAANRAPEVYDQINNFFNRLGYEPERESAERGLSVPRRYPEGNDGNTSESERTATGREATVEGTPVGIAGNIALTHAIEGIKGKFGPSVKINAVSREQMPRGHKQEKGYYDTRTGEVYICVDNVDSIDDAIATIMHECVVHLGLRRLFGERFPEAMRSIYEALTPEARREVNASMRQNGWDAITAMEEYLARLAEKEDFTEQEQNLWDRIKEIFERVLAAITGRDYVALTDNELRYILQASWLNLTAGRGTQLTLQTLAKDTLLKAKYEVNDYEEPEQLFRTPIFPNGTNALSNYERMLKNRWQIAQMEHQDAQQPTRIGINAIQAETGNKPITEDEDYITKENLASSVAQTEQDEFLLQQAQPILEQVDTLIQIITGKKRAFRTARALAYEDIISYIFAKSGAERNRYNNAKLAREEQVADEKKFKETGNHLSAQERKKYAPRDWSGLTSLFGLDKDSHEEAERLADELCSQFEQKVGKDETDLLWDKIRLATDYNLKHALDHGLLTREQYDKLHGNAEKGIPRMWEYYVPLRGFAEETAEEAYDYSNIVNQQANSVVVKQAKGRTTLADDPIANIINIAMTEIRQGNDNLAKVALYRYVFNRPNSLLQPREMWYVKRGDNTWELAEPEPKYDSKNNQIGTESIEDFDARMEQLKAQGLAFKTARGLNMDKIMTNVGHRNEHLIRLKINGVEKGIWVNGDPKLARAVAGSLRTESWKGIRKLVRPLSNLFTTYSLKFALRNLSRDTLYSRMRLMAMSKEMGRGYMLNYSANWAKNFGVLNIPMLKMVAEWNSGKLQKKENPTDREKMFMDFMRDGGPTGYTVTQSVDRIKQDIMRQLRMFRPDGSFMNIAWERAKASDFAKLLGVYPRAVQALNESFELLTRFTAYQTSREMGRSRQQSATDAKEISVNFNRRGAQTGTGFWGITAAYLGATHYFYNAGVQGFQNYMSLFRNHPYKMTAFTAKLLMMGFITPLINILLGSGGDGDDDKKNGIEWYWNLPNWTRRNNIVIGGPKFYIAIALGPEQRAIYGLGDIFAALVEGRYADNSVGNLASDIVSQLTGLLPFNPVEDVNASSNLEETALRSLAPDPLMFLVDAATNRDYTGKPLQKENPFVHDNPNCYGAYSSTPDGIVKACQAIAFETAKRGYMIDLHPGYIRDAFKQYGGGIYQTVEEVGKTVAGIFDPDKPFRISNIPLASGIVGSLDEDRTDSFAKNALNEYRKISENEAKALKVLMHEPKITSKQIYTGQVPKDAPEYIKALYDSDAYKLGKIYYEGENGKYLYAANGKQIKKIEDGLKDYRKSYRDKMDEYARMPKETEADKLAREKKKKEVDKAWDELVEAENRIAQRLLDFEYDHPALTKKIESWLKK